jgi:ribonucleoside-diphosphate reductase alpha chain
MSISVTKRNGKVEPFSVAKIKQAIEWACDGYDVNPLELESKFDEFVKDKMNTYTLHDNLIYQAQSLASGFSPDWVFVAGRLQTMKRWKETKAYEYDFKDFLKRQIDLGYYKHPAINLYSNDDIEELGKCIKQENDLTHSYGSIITAEKKYLLPGECIQHMFMVNAMIIASIEESNRLDLVKTIYTKLSERKISLATPWLSNLRLNGNISSCFIIAVDDSIDSITDNWKNAAMISKLGGGLGIDLSRIRAKGATIAGVKDASGGVCGWAKTFNEIAVNVDQGGKRAGAFTVAVPIWHKDIEDFLEIQSETGDQRKKAHDIFPQIAVHDLFMEAVKAGNEWYTFCPHEVKSVLGVELYGCSNDLFETNYKLAVAAYQSKKLKLVIKFNAKEFMKKIMRTQFETGLPYLFFVDTVNKTNPNKHEGHIPCGNLCQESFSNVMPDQYAHTCNLASIVVGRMSSLEEVIETSKIAAHILDNGITLTTSPVAISKAHNNRYRTVGVGIQGLHDYLARNFTTYNDLETIGKLAETIEYGCILKSIELSSTKGKFEAFEGSMWHTGEMTTNFKHHSRCNYNWDEIQDSINKHGIRNSILVSPPPNTSSSIFMDAAAGVMPVYSAFFREDNSTGKFPVASMHLKLNPLCYSKTFGLHDQVELTKAVGEMQKFVDTGISAEYLFDQNQPGFSAKTLYDTIIAAWENKTKSVYYVRSIKKGATIEDLLGIKDEACVGCAG